MSDVTEKPSTKEGAAGGIKSGPSSAPVVLSDDDVTKTGTGSVGSRERKSPDINPDQIIHTCPICKETSCLEEMVLHLTKHEDFFKVSQGHIYRYI